MFLSRMSMEPSPKQFPMTFKRTQLPIKPAFAMTINKAKGQALGLVGVCLKDSVFSHGQLYVALSRVGNPDNLRVLCDFHHDQSLFHVKNVVYPEVIRQVRNM